MEILCTNTVEDYIDSDRINIKINYFYKFFERILACYILPGVNFKISMKAMSQGDFISALLVILMTICIILLFCFKCPSLIDKIREKI